MRAYGKNPTFPLMTIHGSVAKLTTTDCYPHSVVALFIISSFMDMVQKVCDRVLSSLGPLSACKFRLALLAEGLRCLAGVCRRHGGSLKAERERKHQIRDHL